MSRLFSKTSSLFPLEMLAKAGYTFVLGNESHNHSMTTRDNNHRLALGMERVQDNAD